MPTNIATTPSALIADLYKENNGNWDATRVAVAKAAQSDEVLMDHLAALGIRAAIATLACAERRTVRGGETLEKVLAPGGIERQAARIVHRWFDYPLAGGVRLRDATHDLVAEAARIRIDQANSLRSVGSLFATIAKRLDGSTTVAQAWQEQEISKLAAKLGAQL